MIENLVITAISIVNIDQARILWCHVHRFEEHIDQGDETFDIFFPIKMNLCPRRNIKVCNIIIICNDFFNLSFITNHTRVYYCFSHFFSLFLVHWLLLWCALLACFTVNEYFNRQCFIFTNSFIDGLLIKLW